MPNPGSAPGLCVFARYRYLGSDIFSNRSYVRGYVLTLWSMKLKLLNPIFLAQYYENNVGNILPIIFIHVMNSKI